MVKQVLALDEVPQYDAMEEEQLIKELRQLENMKREVELRLKNVKENLVANLESRDDKTYRSDKYFAYLKEIRSQRLDNQWVKNFLEEQNIKPVMKETIYNKLDIKRID